MKQASVSASRKTLFSVLSLALVCGLVFALAWQVPRALAKPPHDADARAGASVTADLAQGPVTVVVNDATTATVDYSDSVGAHQTTIDPAADTIVIEGTSTTNAIAVAGNASLGTNPRISIVLSNAAISNASDSAFALSNGANVDLTLEGTSTLQSGGGRAGLEVPANCSLVIDDTTGTATLEATSDGDGAGIGGGNGDSAGTIIINGGTVIAASNSGSGDAYGAGIGGGRNGTGGTIAINGGDITAISSNEAGDSYGAGIGSGANGPANTTIVIAGSATVYATSSKNGGNAYGAGIGSGENGSETTVTVAESATVTAYSADNFNGTGVATGTGSAYGAGIGGGFNSVNATVVIGDPPAGEAEASLTEPSVTAASRHSGGTLIEGYGAGIGAGALDIPSGNIYEGTTSITIHGGAVTAASNAGGNSSPSRQTNAYGAGIGEGQTILASNTANNAKTHIEIAGGTVAAYSVSDGYAFNNTTCNSYGAGIGGGDINGAGDSTAINGNFIDITISGGVVDAATGAPNVQGGAGIGGGYDELTLTKSSGTIAIHGGFVTAEGGNPGNGGMSWDIGPGARGSTDSWSLTITGGSVWPVRMQAVSFSIASVIVVDPVNGPFPVAIPLETTIAGSQVDLNSGGEVSVAIPGGSSAFYTAHTVSDAHEHGVPQRSADFENLGYAAMLWLPPATGADTYNMTVGEFAGGHATSEYMKPTPASGITQAKNMIYFEEIAESDWSMANVGDVTFNGAAQTPAPQIAWTGTPFTIDNANFDLAYASNTDAGTATLTATGKGNIAGSHSTDFTIAPADIALTSVSNIDATYSYTGEAITPKPELAFTTPTLPLVLTEGKDYELAYANNVDIGTASAEATGKGNFTGSLSIPFEIVASPEPSVPSAPVVDPGSGSGLVANHASLATVGDSVPWMPLASIALASAALAGVLLHQRQKSGKS